VTEAWFSALGEPLADDEEKEIAAYQARLARAAGAPAGHPFVRKYALYCAGRWPLGLYAGAFGLF
jgi:hypothetical protein